jgi:hypothetical protein
VKNDFYSRGKGSENHSSYFADLGFTPERGAENSGQGHFGLSPDFAFPESISEAIGFFKQPFDMSRIPRLSALATGMIGSPPNSGWDSFGWGGWGDFTFPDEGGPGGIDPEAEGGGEDVGEQESEGGEGVASDPPIVLTSTSEVETITDTGTATTSETESSTGTTGLDEGDDDAQLGCVVVQPSGLQSLSPIGFGQTPPENQDSNAMDDLRRCYEAYLELVSGCALSASGTWTQPAVEGMVCTAKIFCPNQDSMGGDGQTAYQPSFITTPTGTGIVHVNPPGDCCPVPGTWGDFMLIIIEWKLTFSNDYLNGQFGGNCSPFHCYYARYKIEFCCQQDSYFEGQIITGYVALPRPIKPEDIPGLPGYGGGGPITPGG